MGKSPVTLDPELFRSRLSTARARAGLSPRGLSILIGAAPATIGNIEDRRVDNPLLDTAMTIADVLGVALEWLVGATDEEPDWLALTARGGELRARLREADAARRERLAEAEGA